MLLDEAIYGVAHLHSQQVAVPTTKEACLSSSGVWGRSPHGSQEFCRISAKDAGESCFSGFQCSYGTCLAQENSNSWFKTGTCSRYQTEYGCNESISFGTGGLKMCLD